MVCSLFYVPFSVYAWDLIDGLFLLLSSCSCNFLLWLRIHLHSFLVFAIWGVFFLIKEIGPEEEAKDVIQWDRSTVLCGERRRHGG